MSSNFVTVVVNFFYCRMIWRDVFDLSLLLSLDKNDNSSLFIMVLPNILYRPGKAILVRKVTKICF